jgi:hypothetical protein
MKTHENENEMDEFEEVDEEFEVVEDEDDSDGDVFTMYEDPLFAMEAMPFFGIEPSTLEDRYNPKVILQNEKVIVFRPLDKIAPFRTVKPEQLNNEMLKDGFIVSRKKTEHSYKIQDTKKMSTLIEFNTGFIEKYNTTKQKIENIKSRNNFQKSGGFGNNSFSKLTPKNRG